LGTGGTGCSLLIGPLSGCLALADALPSFAISPTRLAPTPPSDIGVTGASAKQHVVHISKLTARSLACVGFGCAEAEKCRVGVVQVTLPGYLGTYLRYQLSKYNSISRPRRDSQSSLDLPVPAIVATINKLPSPSRLDLRRRYFRGQLPLPPPSLIGSKFAAFAVFCPPPPLPLPPPPPQRSASHSSLTSSVIAHRANPPPSPPCTLDFTPPYSNFERERTV